MALCLVVACPHNERTTTPGPGSAEPKSDRITQIPLPESGYVYDVAVTEGDVWVTSHAGLFRVDPASVEATNVLPRDDLFRAEPGHAALWISTGSGGRVLRIDPATSSVTAEIDIGAGPVTHLTMSEDAVWVSAVSDLVRIDPATNEVVRRLRSERGFGDVTINDGGLWVIAGANEKGAVWRIDPITAEVQQKMPSPTRAFGTRWNPRTGRSGSPAPRRSMRTASASSASTASTPRRARSRLRSPWGMVSPCSTRRASGVPRDSGRRRRIRLDIRGLRGSRPKNRPE